VRGAKAWTSEERKLVAHGVTGAEGSAPAFSPLETLSLTPPVLHPKHKGFMSEINLSLDDKPPSTAGFTL
jgi:hypothetical protein